MTAIERAVVAAGSQSALARLIKIKPQAVQKWVSHGRVPAERAIQIESALNCRVTRHELRPDLYPDEKSVSAQ